MKRAHELLEQLLARQLWIFDLDGTLADTSPVHAQAFSEVFGQYGLAVDYSTIAGLTTEDAVAQLLENAGLSLSQDERDELVQDKRKRARAIISAGIPLLEGAKEFLSSYPGRSFALCSSGSRETVRATLAASDLLKRFDPIISAEDVERHKPQPDCFIAALTAHGLRPDQAAVFEDAESGLAAADAANIFAVKMLPATPVVESEGRWTASWPMLNLAKVDDVT